MGHRLRIVYMGTPDFAVLPLKTLVEAGYEVVGVVTNPDKPAGRGQRVQESAVKQYAQEVGLRVLQPEKFRDGDFLAELRALRADLQVVVAFKMLPEVVWNMPPCGTVNLHASLLPDYRGAAPINRAVMNGEKETGVSTFLLRHEIDTGNVIFQERVCIPDTMTAGELHDVLMVRGAGLLLKTVDAIERGDFETCPQASLAEGRILKPAPKIFKEDMRVRWTAPLDTVYDLIRGLSPYPGAWCELEHAETGVRETLKIYSAEKVRQMHSRQPGDTDSDGRTRVDVFVPGGVVRLREVQLSGKRRMAITDFLRGFRMDGVRIV